MSRFGKRFKGKGRAWEKKLAQRERYRKAGIAWLEMLGQKGGNFPDWQSMSSLRDADEGDAVTIMGLVTKGSCVRERYVPDRELTHDRCVMTLMDDTGEAKVFLDVDSFMRSTDVKKIVNEINNGKIVGKFVTVDGGKVTTDGVKAADGKVWVNIDDVDGLIKWYEHLS